VRPFLTFLGWLKRSKVKITPLGIEGAWLIESPVHVDDRGFFTEWFKWSAIEEATGISFVPVQANLSKSGKGVVRGIHYSLAPQGQAKLVTVVRGAIVDYIVDIRIGSSTYGHHEGINLAAGTGKSLLIDPYLGHAFESLEDDTTVSYLVSSEYSPNNEKEITPLCNTLNISWTSNSDLSLSIKDSTAPTLKELEDLKLLPMYRR
jgi:dTDP-4-dehydrorhamnose 3,5-epimerase